jgi:hypothetical protein
MLGLTVFLLSAELSAGCSGEKSSSMSAATGSVSVATTTTGETGEGVPTPGPFTVEGHGPTTRSISIPNDYRPVVILERYPKRSILTVHLRGKGLERSEGESGAFIFDGSPLSWDAEPGMARGQYELAVKGAKGVWSLHFGEPDPDISPFPMLKPIGGRYDSIAKMHLSEASELKWEMQSDAPFLRAKLVGYGDAEGTEQFLGIVQGAIGFAPGKHGFRSDGVMPAGDYLLVVDSDNRFLITFSLAE